VFVDTRAHGFGADPASVRAALTPRTKAIIDIPMWGYHTEVDELHALTQAAGIKLVLDLTHSHGTTLHGRPLSHYDGDVSCFSTHERKPLATGEGGFILTGDDELAQRCRDYSRFGNLNGKDFGLNYKLAALPAALGIRVASHQGATGAMSTPRRSGAGYLALTTLLQRFGERAGWELMRYIDRNVIDYPGSAWEPAARAGTGGVAVGVTVQIAATRRRHAGNAVEIALPHDAIGAEAEVYGRLRGAAQEHASERVLVLARTRSRHSQRRWQLRGSSRLGLAQARRGGPTRGDASG
jgi:DegT/DnrJ/EryC1/StrS aminotransferase family